MGKTDDERLALLARYAEGVHWAFVEAVRRANELARQRDYYRAAALDAECRRREAAGECPEDADDPCPRFFGLHCRACREIEKGARYSCC